MTYRQLCEEDEEGSGPACRILAVTVISFAAPEAPDGADARSLEWQWHRHCQRQSQHTLQEHQRVRACYALVGL